MLIDKRGLWFFDLLDASAGAAYHIAAGLHLRGRLDSDALRAALDRIVSRHESLRTTFVERDGVPLQVIAAAGAGLSLSVHDLAGLDAQAPDAASVRHSEQEVVTPFDLAHGPLIRGHLLRLAADEHILLLTLHHIAGDAWSIGVLLGEVQALYAAFSERRADRWRRSRCSTPTTAPGSAAG